MLVLGITTQSGIYRTILVLHILCAIVGFGAVMLNAIYGAESKKRPGPEGIVTWTTLLQEAQPAVPSTGCRMEPGTTSGCRQSMLLVAWRFHP